MIRAAKDYTSQRIRKQPMRATQMIAPSPARASPYVWLL